MSKRYIQPLRLVIQAAFLLLSLYLGITFYFFVGYIGSGMVGAPFVRHEGIEAFLPISGLLGLKDWVANGAINPIHPAAVVIFISVVAVSLLLKRSFCSWICPVGTLSELLWKLGFNQFRRNIRPPRWLDLLLRGVKFLLMGFFLYSILYAMGPEEVRYFIHTDYNKIADLRLLQFFLHMSALALLIITLLVLLSTGLRNPFCRYFCPYGALLGLVSMLSPVKVTRDKAACVSCGVCNQVCPAYIRVMAQERVHSEECIGCFRCISYCRAEKALDMKLHGRKVVVSGLTFAFLVVLSFWGGTMIGKMTGHWHTSISNAEYRRLMGR